MAMALWTAWQLRMILTVQCKTFDWYCRSLISNIKLNHSEHKTNHVESVIYKQARKVLVFEKGLHVDELSARYRHLLWRCLVNDYRHSLAKSIRWKKGQVKWRISCVSLHVYYLYFMSSYHPVPMIVIVNAISSDKIIYPSGTITILPTCSKLTSICSITLIHTKPTINWNLYT